MKTIKTHHHGWLLYQANCQDCSFGACIFTPQTPSPEAVRAAARSHVLSTGHDVTIEAGKSWNYSLDNASRTDSFGDVADHDVPQAKGDCDVPSI